MNVILLFSWPSSTFIFALGVNLLELQDIAHMHWFTPFFYKQSIFDPCSEKCLNFSKKSPPKIV